MHRRNNTYLLDVWAGTAAQSACSFRSTSQEMLGDVWVSWLHMYVCRQLCTCACSRELYPKHAPTCDADIQTDRPTWTKFFPLQEKRRREKGGSMCLSVCSTSVRLSACLHACCLSGSSSLVFWTIRSLYLAQDQKKTKGLGPRIWLLSCGLFFSRRRIKKRRTNQW